MLREWRSGCLLPAGGARGRIKRRAAIALEGLIAIGALRTGAAFRGHIVRTAAGVLGSGGSQAFADFENPLAVFLGEGHIEPGAAVIDAHEKRGFAIVVLDQKAIGGGLDDVRIMRPARGAGVFALDGGEAVGRAQDGVGFAFESVACREENGTRLLEIVGGDQRAGGKCGFACDSAVLPRCVARDRQCRHPARILSEEQYNTLACPRCHSIYPQPSLIGSETFSSRLTNELPQRFHVFRPCGKPH